MSDQKTPRSINLNNARGGSPATPPQRTGQRPLYDQAANTQRPSSQAASGQVRRVAGLSSEPRMNSQTMRQATAQTRRPDAAQGYAREARGAQPQSMRTMQGVQQNPQGYRGAAQQGQPLRHSAQQGKPGYIAGGGARPAQQGYAPRTAQRQSGQTTASQRMQGAGSGAYGAPRRTAQQIKQAKKAKAMNRFLIAVSATLAVLLVAYISIQVWGGTIINSGDMGMLNPVIATPPQFRQDQLNLLVLGIDYSTEDAVVRDPIGMTDMIMYVRFDFKANTMKMLQIPRDLFVGKELPTGGTGKINAIFQQTKDTENRVRAVQQVIYDTLKLPVDEYLTIDMDSLRAMVDHFGGIEVYVPQAMAYKGSHLEKGLQMMSGAACEYFLRERHSFATGDIARLDNQRFFYSALFRRIRTADWKEIVKLMPVVQMYVKTSLSLNDSMGVGIKVLKIPSAQIMMCRLPTYDSTQNYNSKYAVQVAAQEESAALLNEYFRTPETALSAAELGFADWAHGDTAHPSNVQWMADIDTQGGGSAGEAADGAQTGDDLLAPTSTAASPAAKPAA